MMVNCLGFQMKRHMNTSFVIYITRSSKSFMISQLETIRFVFSDFCFSLPGNALSSKMNVEGVRGRKKKREGVECSFFLVQPRSVATHECSTLVCNNVCSEDRQREIIWVVALIATNVVKREHNIGAIHIGVGDEGTCGGTVIRKRSLVRHSTLLHHGGRCLTEVILENPGFHIAGGFSEGLELGARRLSQREAAHTEHNEQNSGELEEKHYSNFFSKLFSSTVRLSTVFKRKQQRGKRKSEGNYMRGRSPDTLRFRKTHCLPSQTSNCLFQRKMNTVMKEGETTRKTKRQCSLVYNTNSVFTILVVFYVLNRFLWCRVFFSAPSSTKATVAKEVRISPYSLPR